MASKKISNALLALSTAAIMTVYAAGFERTAPAAAKFAAQTEQRVGTMTLPPGPAGQQAPRIAGMNVGLPGSFQAPVAGAAGPVPLSAPPPVAALNPIPEPVAPVEAAVSAPVLQPEHVAPAAPAEIAAAPISEPAPVVREPEVSSTAAPVETPVEQPVLIAASTPEPAPTSEPAPAAAPEAVAEVAPTPAPKNEPAPAPAPARKAEPAPKAVKEPKPPKPPKEVKVDPKKAQQQAAALAANKPAAPQPAPQPAPEPAAPPAPVLQDGTFTGWGTSRHGDIQASITIQSGRIVDARISQCETRYPCSVIPNAARQVVERQSPAVDLVAGATQSVYAFYYAVLEALTKAQ